VSEDSGVRVKCLGFMVSNYDLSAEGFEGLGVKLLGKVNRQVRSSRAAEVAWARLACLIPACLGSPSVPHSCLPGLA